MPYPDECEYGPCHGAQGPHEHGDQIDAQARLMATLPRHPDMGDPEATARAQMLQRQLEAEKRRRELHEAIVAPTAESTVDPRIRLVVGDYRVVAPNAKSKDGRVYANGRLVVEKRGKNALGEVTWTLVTTVNRPTANSSENDEVFYTLLANGVADGP